MIAMLPFTFSRPADQPLRMLCLGAHSDDIEIGCGGTVLTLLARQADVQARWVVFSGAGARAEEATASAASFLAGAASRAVTIHHFRDGYFPAQWGAIKERFESLKGDFAPDLVFTHAREDRHQDHRVISDLTWNTFRDHTILEYEIPKYDGDLGRPNIYVPIDEATCARKIHGLLTHFATQRSKPWFDADTFRALLRLRGMEANSPTRFAEAFYGRKLLWQ
jgi:LmbE family N-acetylglucosaminyl deacetylase